MLLAVDDQKQIRSCSGDRSRLRLSRADLRRRAQLPQQSDSLTRYTANFDPISQAAVTGNLCTHDDRRPGRQELEKLPAARRTRELHPGILRMDVEAHRHRPYGQMLTPFVIMRAISPT